MRLVIVDKNGNAYEVVDNLEEYNLAKPMAKADLMADIISTLDKATKAEEN